MQILPDLKWNNGLQTESLSSDKVLDAGGKKLAKDLPRILGLYARAVAENVGQQFQRGSSNPSDKWQVFNGASDTRWKLEKDQAKTLFAIKSGKGLDKEVFEVNVDKDFKGDLKWQSRLGNFTAKLKGSEDSPSPKVKNLELAWQAKSFKDFTTEAMTTGTIDDSKFKQSVIRTLLAETKIKELIANNPDLVSLSEFSQSARFDKLPYRSQYDTFKIVLNNGDGEFIVRMKGAVPINIERRSKEGQFLAVVRSKGKELLSPDHSNVVFFNGLTSIDSLPGLDKSRKTQTAPMTVETLLKEAEAIRDLYYYGIRVDHSLKIDQNFRFERNRPNAQEPYFKLQGPNGNELHVSMNNDGQITNIQRISPELTISVLPGDQKPIKINTPIQVLGLGSDTAPITVVNSLASNKVESPLLPPKPVTREVQPNGIHPATREQLKVPVVNGENLLRARLQALSSR